MSRNRGTDRSRCSISARSSGSQPSHSCVSRAKPPHLSRPPVRSPSPSTASGGRFPARTQVVLARRRSTTNTRGSRGSLRPTPLGSAFPARACGLTSSVSLPVTPRDAAATLPAAQGYPLPPPPSPSRPSLLPVRPRFVPTRVRGPCGPLLSRPELAAQRPPLPPHPTPKATSRHASLGSPACDEAVPPQPPLPCVVECAPLDVRWGPPSLTSSGCTRRLLTRLGVALCAASL